MIRLQEGELQRQMAAETLYITKMLERQCHDALLDASLGYGVAEITSEYYDRLLVEMEVSA
jgi:hypothetical protein